MLVSCTTQNMNRKYKTPQKASLDGDGIASELQVGYMSPSSSRPSFHSPSSLPPLSLHPFLANSLRSGRLQNVISKVVAHLNHLVCALLVRSEAKRAARQIHQISQINNQTTPSETHFVPFFTKSPLVNGQTRLLDSTAARRGVQSSILPILFSSTIYHLLRTKILIPYITLPDLFKPVFLVPPSSSLISSLHSDLQIS
jgi:hypothetical protein